MVKSISPTPGGSGSPCGWLTWPVLRGRFIGRTRISRSVYFRMDKDRSGGAGFFDILRALYPSVSFRELLRPCKVDSYGNLNFDSFPIPQQKV